MPETAQTALAGALRILAEGGSLTAEQAAEAFGVVMRGEASPAQMAGLLMGLRAKGESVEEVAGAALALRAAMTRLPWAEPDRLVDTCGTGGGAVVTINLSTAAAFVVAGAGVRVAKHGNRSYTSRSGSADVLEALGVEVALPPERAAAVLEEVGLAFLFAPAYHPAMRHLAPTRKELAVPTIMNLLGPLANPAGVRRQVVGVADPARGPLVAGALRRLGAAHALVVHGAVGMDEISPSGPTAIWEVTETGVREWMLDPAALGYGEGDLAELAGGEPRENAERIEQVLRCGERGAARSAVILNAAAALYVAGRGLSFADAVREAERALDDGRAARVLDRLREVGQPAAGSRQPSAIS